MTLGMMQAAVFIGSSIGPLFGGVVADAYGYRAAFQAGALLLFLGGLFVHFGAHENFSREKAEEENRHAGIKSVLFLKGFLAAVLIMLAVHFGNTMVNPSFPLIVKEILPGVKNLNSITGSVVAASALSGAVSAAFLGFAGDKFGHRRILIVCCLAACMASTGHYFVRNLNELFAARILFGIAIAGMLPSANAMIHSIVDRRSVGKAYGIANSISMIGIAFGPLVGGYVARAGGLRMPFLLSAAAQFLLGWMVFVFIKPVRKQ